MLVLHALMKKLQISKLVEGRRCAIQNGKTAKMERDEMREAIKEVQFFLFCLKKDDLALPIHSLYLGGYLRKQLLLGLF